MTSVIWQQLSDSSVETNYNLQIHNDKWWNVSELLCMRYEDIIFTFTVHLFLPVTFILEFLDFRCFLTKLIKFPFYVKVTNSVFAIWWYYSYGFGLYFVTRTTYVLHFREGYENPYCILLRLFSIIFGLGMSFCDGVYFLFQNRVLSSFTSYIIFSKLL